MTSAKDDVMPRRAMLLLFPWFFLMISSVPAWGEETSEFKQGVGPLLSQRCVSCHNETKKRGGLDLTTRTAMLRGSDGGPVIVERKSAQSLLLKMVSGPQPKMPRQGPKLTPEEIAVLRKWIDDGAPWPKDVKLVEEKVAARDSDWWSLKPLTRPAVPVVKDQAGVANPIDAFVRAGLETRGLRPSPPANRVTLIRRVTFDLHGLPPTPEEIDVFVNDRAPDAYEKVVERLLASPRYGERWGRHWLDVVRYGDTHGYDKDKRRDFAWPYRDYVIGSFNTDKPYSRFLKEQLAGDVLEPGKPDGVIATGFIAAGPWDFVGHVELREGTVDKEKTRVLDRDDMVSNTVATFMSLTVHCARCHDHKFDPIPQTDYYRLQAVFAGVERGNRPYSDPQHLARKKQLDEEAEKLARSRAALQEKINALTNPELVKVQAALQKVKDELASLPPIPAGKPSPTNGYHSGISQVPDVAKWVQVDLGKPLPLDELRLIPARPTDFPDSPGFGFPIRFRIEVSNDPDFHKADVVVDQTSADFTNPGDNPYLVPLKGRTARYVRVTATRLWKRTNDYVFALAELQVDSGGRNLAPGSTVTALDSIEAGRWSKKYLIDQFDSRHELPDLSEPKLAAKFRQRLELLARAHELDQQRQQLSDHLIDPGLRQQLAQTEAAFTALEKKRQELSAQNQVYAVVPRPPRPIHVLHRGDVEQPRRLASAGALACVNGLNPNFKESNDEGQRRVALAEWIADPNNPLTWRSIANRIWHYHFGRGLVDTPNDFGRNGSQPTHPELLDWLAVEFRDNGGSFKKLHRLILLSSTYRQASRHDPAAAKIDADNRYLWRMNRQRLDAEEVRDTVLAISGKLDLTMGGPGFELFRFKDDHSPIYDHSVLEKIHDPATYRRTVYRFTVRSVPNPFLECLDCADPNINTPVRNTTLTALQALALLNDPFIVKQADYLAARLRKQTDDLERQIEAAYRLTLGRSPSAEDRALLAGYGRKHGLCNACRVLFNANEFVFID
jgi:hypothetical protein